MNSPAGNGDDGPALELLGSGAAFHAQLLAMLQGSEFFGDFPAPGFDMDEIADAATLFNRVV